MIVDAFMPVGLKCEYCECPVGIDTPNPMLGWLVSTSQNGIPIRRDFWVLCASCQLLQKTGIRRLHTSL